MQPSNRLISFWAFTAIWSVWLIWGALQPVLSTAQLAVVFLFLPLSLLLLAFSFFDDEDDDDQGGGILQPVLRRVRY